MSDSTLRKCQRETLRLVRVDRGGGGGKLGGTLSVHPAHCLCSSSGKHWILEFVTNSVRHMPSPGAGTCGWEETGMHNLRSGLCLLVVYQVLTHRMPYLISSMLEVRKLSQRSHMSKQVASN